MGIVYEAEELGPVRRRVALKLIKPGVATRASIARIEAERQALAVMSHPAIASVFHAGATEEGQPYFAMELANGSPLTEFCDTQRLNVRERLELFLEVCRGVQHAHQKGVIHRDLKPSNVLVIQQDGRLQPKIIDFGIAKALGHQLTDHTIVTQEGQPIGTAAYMSPEQATTGVDVDTRADIYALGVILYELIAGELPVSPAGLGIYVFMTSLAAGHLNPPPPSARLDPRDRESAMIAHLRRTDPHRLRREVHGDLDRIVLKAIEPDRGHRYETVSALATDIQRFLAHEPILARPPSAGYRFRKFFQRHRAGVVAAGLAGAALLVGSVATSIGMVRATNAERVAAQEAAAAQQVTNFLVDLFEQPDPYVSAGDEITARAVLDRGVERVRRDLSGQPRTYGRILHTMGRVYGNLGSYDDARRLLEDALRARERHYGPDHPEVAETLNEIGAIAFITGQYDHAEAHYNRALAIAQRHQPRGTTALIGALSGLAGIRVRSGAYDEAEALYLRARAIEADTRQADATQPPSSLGGLAAVYYYQGRLREAEALMRELLAAEERAFGPNHPAVAATLNNLGGVLYNLGRYADALPLYERARMIHEATLGEWHPDLALNLTNIGEVDWKLRRYGEAEVVLRRALDIYRRVMADDAPQVATTLNALANVLRDQRRYAEAEPLYRQALAIRERAQHSWVDSTLKDYALLLRSTGRPGDAAALEARAAR
jgi:eukaryotic-like serine/threonine-protein kinase